MVDYAPPLDDIRLVLHEVADIEGIRDLPGHQHVDPATLERMPDALGPLRSDARR